MALFVSGRACVSQETGNGPLRGNLRGCNWEWKDHDRFIKTWHQLFLGEHACPITRNLIFFLSAHYHMAGLVHKQLPLIILKPLARLR
ncbi:hypothetical protein Pelo_3385 [Pelomyxa schiedti]|nr:hypothetical protein Pelo_3385 [Pelomyxa schiedti]